jgi:hypothetical protein
VEDAAVPDGARAQWLRACGAANGQSTPEMEATFAWRERQVEQLASRTPLHPTAPAVASAKRVAEVWEPPPTQDGSIV